MIVSTTSGRMRVRANRLKSKKIAEKVKNSVEEIDGVNHVRVNTGACSIVVHFDAAKIDPEPLEDQVIEICTPPKNGAPTLGKTLSKRVNQATKVGMMGALATSLVYGYTGNKKKHILFGKVFLSFASWHMIKHSKTLLR